MANAQNKMEGYGSLKGIVRDSINNYVLKSATVSVHKTSNQDKVLINYQITNTYGEFNFSNIPVGVPLELKVNNVGYHSLNKRFTIPTDTKFINLNTLILHEKTTSLEEVEIVIPPISMNGDTLEFNAAAFKLDTNAVVEDLLRKIPNITLWGDGKITVNGREVKGLLVNGKEFFGGNYKITTQNIAKNAVEKVQVYTRLNNQNNPLDSIVEMNVKLKKGKEFGYFGKIGLGYGTNKRYEIDANINVFTPKMQFVIVGAMNNINKLANNIHILSNNSTFKGGGANIEYRPDFSLSGINRPRAIGSTFTYDFIENPSYENIGILNLNYFMLDKHNDNSSNTETTTITNSSDKILDNSIYRINSDSREHKFDAKFEWTKKRHSLTVYQALTSNHNNSNTETYRNSLNGTNTLISKNTNSNRISGTSKDFDFSINYKMNENRANFSQKFKGVNASYVLGIDKAYNERMNETDFQSYVNPSFNRKFNRKYQTESDNINQQFDFELTKLKEVIFGEINLLGFDFSIINNISLNSNKNNDLIEDFNNITLRYEKNFSLINQLQSDILEETPGFVLHKSISRDLSNRFTKNWSLSLAAKQKMIYQDNRSSKSFQNIQRTYSRFLPEILLNYNNNQYGEYNRKYSLSYNTSIKMPSIQQLAPLIDSANIDNIQKGNLNLEESVDRNLTFSFNHEDQTTNNTLNYSFSVNIGSIEDNIIDSTMITNDNRRTTYFTNAIGSRYFNFNGNIRKAIKLKTSELQLGLTSLIGISKTPSYLNDVFTFSSNFHSNTNLKLNYTYRDYFAFEGMQSYSTYKSKQEAFKTEYSGITITTTLTSSYNVTKRLNINSNITFNRNTSTNSTWINFTILNASATFRLLKGNNLELKFSALDLFHQNNSVINYGNSNSFTIGTRNVLQNYFMTTISYYPRQFGKKGSKK